MLTLICSLLAQARRKALRPEFSGRSSRLRNWCTVRGVGCAAAAAAPLLELALDPAAAVEARRAA